MDGFGSARLLAREKHRKIRAAAKGDGRAVALLGEARKDAGLKVQRVPPMLPQLGGGDGALHRASNAIFLSNELSPDLEAFVEAHEYGHFWLETPDDPAVVLRSADPGQPEEPTPLGLARVEAYSPHDLRERMANVFAREFLLPRDEARRLFIDEKMNAPAIAAELGVPLGLVHQQLATSLLLPDVPEPKPEGATAERPGLDASQELVAQYEGRPLLVEAGPGTGKTRTLIARIEWLLGKGAPPGSILALTFSNKAASEIRERVADSLPLAAPEIWAGTFHAFGLEILRKYGEAVGIAGRLNLLDQADQLLMLEADLAELGLDHYLRLYDPLLELKHVLGAISRAKDEVKSPEDYAAAAAAMAQSARNDEEVLRAAKAGEVARVFAYYEARLRRDGKVDFADLINLPMRLLRENDEVRRELRGQYAHILVDEYQDVNRGSALLVKELAGEGEGLWAVGDARQSIYRFRGAAPINTRDWEKDYPQGDRKPLAVNYRSKQGVVALFGAYAGAMAVGGRRRVELEPKRGAGEETVDFHIARDREAEIAGIAQAIETHREAGIPYREQAVLCRVHGNLEKIALGLEATGIPVLYLGDLFERSEVRDLLAILSFVCEPRRGGLLRLAELAPYRMDLADVRRFLTEAGERDCTPFDLLSKLDEIDGLTPAGRTALATLREDLAGTSFRTGPGSLLCHLLFDRGSLLRDQLGDESAAGQQRRLAVHQFLQFAIENDKTQDEDDPKRRLLAWVRRLEVFGDERALRDPPAAVAGIDAVRLMTVHASKGLEFRVVHLPVLGKGLFPKKRQGERCPLPDGLLPTTPADDHDEEEECLFYVALSRARDHLSLSRAERYSEKQKSNPSDALAAIGAYLPRSPSSSADWTDQLPFTQAEKLRADLADNADEYDGRDIELYANCPRSYLYQKVLSLSRNREDDGYVRFHRALYRVLGWMQGQGTSIDQAALLQEFETAWRDIGPYDHPLAALYRSAAENILEEAHKRPREGISFGETLRVSIDGHAVRVPIDELERSPQGTVVRRLRTGRPPARPDQRMLHALMLQAGREQEGTARFEAHYLTTGEATPVSLDGVMASRLSEAKAALAGIKAGEFPRKVGENCPRCPHYFICPSVPL